MSGSALQSLTGSSHTEQTNASPSVVDSAGGVKDISVSAIFNFLSVEESDCLFDLRATETLN